MPRSIIHPRFSVVDEDGMPTGLDVCGECNAVVYEMEPHDDWHRRTHTESPSYPPQVFDEEIHDRDANLEEYAYGPRQRAHPGPDRPSP